MSIVSLAMLGFTYFIKYIILLCQQRWDISFLSLLPDWEKQREWISLCFFKIEFNPLPRRRRRVKPAQKASSSLATVLEANGMTWQDFRGCCCLLSPSTSIIIKIELEKIISFVFWFLHIRFEEILKVTTQDLRKCSYHLNYFPPATL